jgi:competence protein ComEC
MREFTRKQWAWFYAVCVGLLVLAVFQAIAVSADLQVSVLDVGQGDAILIKTPEHHNILIDAGPDGGVVEGLAGQMGFFDKTIDLFILTHPHRDHHGGILDVMQKYDVRRVMLTGADAGDPVYSAFLDAVRDRGTEVWFANSAEDVQIGPGLYLDVLFPFSGQSLVGQDVHNKNNTSIVARLVRWVANDSEGQIVPLASADEVGNDKLYDQQFGEIPRFTRNDKLESLAMLTGDAEVEEEREILLAGFDVRADVLKLGHHGSRTATSDAFLAAVSPGVAIVSAGEGNKFEHPHPETMAKVQALEVKQTMLEGNIEFQFSRIPP